MGVLFKTMPDGTGYQKLIDFAGATNGRQPRGSLLSVGTFIYGMTNYGGTNDYGTIFKIKSDGTGFVKLLDFAPDGISGIHPFGSLISDGTFLYGMTWRGGINDYGTIFKIMPDGTGYAKILDFAGVTNGSYPGVSLLFDGTFLYGMTYEGGTANMGTLFKIMPDGTGYLKLLDFTSTGDGSFPYGALISDGTFLYGMTYGGGTIGWGIVFKIRPDGTGYQKLFDFAGETTGRKPHGSLISDGTFLYGMTNQGGINDMGTVFKIMHDGTGFVKLVDFNGVTNGNSPRGSLISDGTFLYGMTKQGGINDMGVVFKYQHNTTSIQDLSDKQAGLIFPNPFYSYTTLQAINIFKNATLTVYNSFGQQIKQIQNISGKEIIL